MIFTHYESSSIHILALETDRYHCNMTLIGTEVLRSKSIMK